MVPSVLDKNLVISSVKEKARNYLNHLEGRNKDPADTNYGFELEELLKRYSDFQEIREIGEYIRKYKEIRIEFLKLDESFRLIRDSLINKIFD